MSAPRFAKVPEQAARELLKARPLLLRVYVAHRLASDFVTGISKRPAAELARELESKPSAVSAAERELAQLGLVRLLSHGRGRELSFVEQAEESAPKQAKAPVSATVEAARARYNEEVERIATLPEGEEKRRAFKAALAAFLEVEKNGQ